MFLNLTGSMGWLDCQDTKGGREARECKSSNILVLPTLVWSVLPFTD